MSIVINALNNSLIRLDENTPCVVFSSSGTFRLGLYTIAGSWHTSWDGKLFYSFDKRNWYEWDGTATNASNVIYLCGIGNTRIAVDGGYTSAIHFHSRTPSSSLISCTGDLATLLDFRKYSGNGAYCAPSYSFAYAFSKCDGLVSVENIGFSAVDRGAFSHTFEDCSDLKKPPALPATTLSYMCYLGMFDGCKSLERLPKLPATTIPDYAYAFMFASSGVKISDNSTIYQYEFRIPASGIGTASSNSLQSMFTGSPDASSVVINTPYYTDKPLVE